MSDKKTAEELLREVVTCIIKHKECYGYEKCHYIIDFHYPELEIATRYFDQVALEKKG